MGTAQQCGWMGGCAPAVLAWRPPACRTCSCGMPVHVMCRPRPATQQWTTCLPRPLLPAVARQAPCVLISALCGAWAACGVGRSTCPLLSPLASRRLVVAEGGEDVTLKVGGGGNM